MHSASTVSSLHRNTFLCHPPAKQCQASDIVQCKQGGGEEEASTQCTTITVLSERTTRQNNSPAIVHVQMLKLEALLLPLYKSTTWYSSPTYIHRHTPQKAASQLSTTYFRMQCYILVVTRNATDLLHHPIITVELYFGPAAHTLKIYSENEFLSLFLLGHRCPEMMQFLNLLRRGPV